MTWYLFVIFITAAGGFELHAVPTESAWACQQTAQAVERLGRSTRTFCEPRGRV